MTDNRPGNSGQTSNPVRAALTRRQFARAGIWTAAGLSGAAAGAGSSTATVPAAPVLNRVYTITARERARGTDMPKNEFRAFWVASVTNIDWPSQRGLTAAEQQKELRGWLDLARSLNFNAVLLQIRPAADVFWPSARGEPWSRYLTGVQGRNPGYDPLGYAVAQAHERNLQLHAWFNPFRVSLAAPLTDLVSWHPVRTNPTWSFAYGGRRYYNPGLPAVRSFIIGVVNEVAAGYDVDGVHLDDYFYPYPEDGEAIPDSDAYQAYRTAGESQEDFRRRSVNLFVRDLGSRIRTTKPRLLYGISPFGIWRNSSTDKRGSATSGFEAYDGIYADSRQWVKQNWIGYVAPQLYWNQGLAAADYNVLVDWWAAQTAGTSVRLYIGEAAHKVGDAAQGTAWLDPKQLYNHTAKCRATPAVAGQVYYSAKSVRANKLGAATLVRNKYYRRVAMTPVMAQRGARRPYTPVIASARWNGTGVELVWRGATTGTVPRHYAVYRWASSGAAMAYIPSQAGALRQVHRRLGNPERFLDTGAVKGRTYWYMVAALSDTMVESAGASAIFIRA